MIMRRTTTVVGGAESESVVNSVEVGCAPAYIENNTPVTPTLKPAKRIRDDVATCEDFLVIVVFVIVIVMMLDMISVITMIVIVTFDHAIDITANGRT